MSLEYFIAKRIGGATTDNRASVMMRIAVVAVALSVAVMIISMAVIFGFKREVTDKIVGFAAHVEVTDVRGIGSLDAEPVVRNDTIERMISAIEGFRSMSPYAVKGGIVKTDDAMQGVVLKGVDRDYDLSFFARHLIDGTLPRIGDTIRTKDIILSRGVASKLNVEVGDKVEMLFVESGAMPRRDRFKVSGIYSSGMDEMDNTMIMTDLRNVQRLSSWSHDRVSGYEVRLDDIGHATRYADALNEELMYSECVASQGLVATTVEELYPNIFDWLKAHNVNAAVVITIMLVVALFNMMSALLILVFERTRMIGILKAMGMNNRSLQRVFLFRALRLIVNGLLWGNLVGVSLCLVQMWTHVLRLDAQGYMLSWVPVDFGVGWWALLNVGVVVVITLLLTLPTYIVSYIKPEESIKYQ